MAVIRKILTITARIESIAISAVVLIILTSNSTPSAIAGGCNLSINQYKFDIHRTFSKSTMKIHSLTHYDAEEFEKIRSAIDRYKELIDDLQEHVIMCAYHSRSDLDYEETKELIRLSYIVLEEKKNTFISKEEKKKSIESRKEKNLLLKETLKDDLIYADENISLEFSNIWLVKELFEKNFWFEGETTIILVELTVINQNKIIKPQNYYSFGYDSDSPNVGGSSPTNVKLNDNFDNSFGLSDIEPKYHRTRNEKGIKPNESKEFKIIFTDTPLSSTKHLILTISKSFFGSKKDIIFKIPYSTLFP